jgi:DNA-binding CsgD family transcriptional regulator
LGEEAVALATQTRQHVLGAFAAAVLARPLAGQGREDRCRSLVTDALAAAEQYGIPPVRLYALQALGLLELSLGRAEAAIRSLRIADDTRAAVGLGDPSVVPYVADLAEALIRIGERREANQALELLETMTSATGSIWADGTGSRCRAMMAEENHADALFARSSERLATFPMPFEQARTLLCWGEALRRRRHVAECRSRLEKALAIFEALGARPWADRTRAELRATGARPTVAAGAGLSELTSQELQITLAVAEGMSNRQIATALFVSPKTVEYHLGKVYAKLHVSSRTQLSRLIASSREAVATSSAGGRRS